MPAKLTPPQTGPCEIPSVEARQVLADSLLSSADPLERVRGELISIAVQRTTSPWKRMLDRHTHALLEQHGEALLGPFLAHLDPGKRPPHVVIDWHLGLVRRVRLEHQLFQPETPGLGALIEAL